MKPAGRRPDALTPLQGLRYGALGAPLAFAALPLYVLLPSHYGASLGVPLSSLGAVLLATRALDALVDPWLGRLADRVLARPRRDAMALAAMAAVLMAVGFATLFFPPAGNAGQLLTWCAAALVTTGCALLVLALWALGGAPYRLARPSLAYLAPDAAPDAARTDPWLPWRVPAFRRLMAVFLLNGVASAIPATLLLFFIRDRLQAPAWEPALLGGYFAAAALSMPLWVRAASRWGLLRCWLAGMALAISAFVWAARLGPGDTTAFALICAASGAAFGADLAVPGALLAGVIRRAGHGLHHEGQYFGWWTGANKLNLALAAGVSLPLLQSLGYSPGARDAAALGSLALIYAALPCLFKGAAAALLWHHRHTLDRP